MQKRYCSCGQQIFVMFDFSLNVWRAFFYNGHPSRSHRTSTCPSCGAQLHIDQVR